jgi:hypothetical protein
MNIHPRKTEFLQRLSNIKDKLPRNCTSLLKDKFPESKSSRFYAIKAGKVVDFQILEALEKLVEILEKQ